MEGKIIGMAGFGSSAPGPVLYEKFGFTADKIIAAEKK
jgi:transketolase